ncbi:MAG: hypothetical protein IJJ58_01680 [Campylobacter sp.]|nr:hypothetical protein [Campylobacter sp.]
MKTKKKENISVVLGDTKYFYEANLVATEKQNKNILVTKGVIPEGEVNEYYSAFKCIKHYKRGKLDGPLIVRDGQTGEVILKETYQNGVLQSKKETNIKIDTKDNKSSIGKTFTRSVFERIFFDNGKEVARQILNQQGEVVKENGKVYTGHAKEFYSNGSLKREAYFEKGLPQGKVNIYDQNGRIIAIEQYEKGLKNGQTLLYNFVQNVLSEERVDYKSGLIDGKHQLFGPNGKLILTEEYKADKLNGTREIFFQNGRPSSKEHYKDGKLEGTRQLYYESGQILYEEFYVNGKLQGQRKGYYPDGSLYLQESYLNGLLEGKRITFDKNGQIKLQENYKEGKLIK